MSCNIQFLYKLRHIICFALVEVLSILNILYGFASFIFPGYYFPQKLCRRSLWWLPNQLKPWSVLCLLYTQSVTGVFFQGGFLIAHIITRLQYYFQNFKLIEGILSSNYRSQTLSSTVLIENPSWDSSFPSSLGC